MNKTILIAAAAIVATIWSAKADDVITAFIAPVCKADVILSAKAQAACDGDLQKLKMLKDGTRLRNVGIGAEFNTLRRNVDGGKL